MRLAARDIVYQYPGAPSRVVDDVSFEASAGQITVLSGPSGCGKSTILDLLGGLRRADAGVVELERDAARLPVGEYDVSWVAQSNPVLGGRTALDNVAIPMLAQGRSMREARSSAADVLGEVGLHHRADARVGDLSGGEVQRVAIARCLMTPSEVLLADEPTGQLDGRNTRLVVAALRASASAGRVVVIASHDAWVMEQCDTHVPLRSAVSYE